MAQGVFTPYSTVEPLVGVLPSWVPAEEQLRVASYQIYEEIYWNKPSTFSLLLRGSDSKPLYVPSGRIIVETMNRFCGKDFRLETTSLNDQEKATLDETLRNFLARERFRAKFSSGKRYGLIRGDWIIHVVANGTKPEGTRISLRTVDPASYFPVYADDDVDNLVKIHLAEQYVVGDKTLVRRQTYERVEGSTTILSSVTLWEPDKWRDVADAAPVQVLLPPTPLPPQITAFPVYHIANSWEDGNPFGSSEMRGIEVLMAGINQSISDEDVALALEGLGVYRSANGRPIDPETGEETDWFVYPGAVIEDESFSRVPGIGSVAPVQDHIKMLWDFAQKTIGASSAATGSVDVQVAESGIALAMQMSPLLARGQEKDVEISGVMNQMFYDLRTMWFPAYEGLNFPDSMIECVFGNPLPVNEDAEVAKYISLVTEGIMSKTTARERLAERGIKFSVDELTRLAQEAQMALDLGGGLGAGSAADPYAGRVNAELSADGSASADGATEA